MQDLHERFFKTLAVLDEGLRHRRVCDQSEGVVGGERCSCHRRDLLRSSLSEISNALRDGPSLRCSSSMVVSTSTATASHHRIFERYTSISLSNGFTLLISRSLYVYMDLMLSYP